MKTIEQSLKRNGSLDAQGIEMRLVGGGGGGGERVLSASGPIQNAFVGSSILSLVHRAGATINNLSSISAAP